MSSASPITVNESLCSGCGRCVSACGPHVLELRDHKAAYVSTRELGCFACGHCMMSCPHDAIQVDGIKPEELAPLQADAVDTDSLHAFLAARRSVRKFKAQPVERATLERILELAATAPMGFPPHSVNVVVLNQPDELDHLGTVLRHDYGKMLDGYNSTVGRLVMRAMMSKALWSVIGSHVVPVARDALALWSEKKEDRFLHGAPALMLFHADGFGASPDEDCHLVCAYAMLAAHSMGVGSTILGIVPPIVERSKALRERYGIPARHRVATSLILGYPKEHYRKTIRRPLQSVRFV
ncbi:MAG: nitroreductase family protein [Myxococcota bacterium]|nr:nitroreductase family protein [Myxococcota bacterium]